jgi:predicted PurR-regulated permease PerM
LAFGNFWQAIALLIGALVVSITDNLLRGPLVGKDTQMHPLIVLLSTLGGIVLFGVSGFVIGPIVAALFISVMSIYSHYYKTQLDNN